MAEGGMVDGKAALVTGAGRGIGRAFALAMAREGAKVVVNDLGGTERGAGADRAPALEVVKEIEDAGGQAVADFGSVADREAAEAMVARAESAFGRIDIVVNNAGILRDAIFHKMTHDDWDAVIDVHLKGSFNVSRAAATRFRAQGSGAFIHMTSTSGARRQCRPGELRRRKTRHRRAVEIHRPRHGALRRALQRHLALRVEPHDRHYPRHRRGSGGAGSAPQAHDPRQDRPRRGLSGEPRRRRGEGERPDIRGAQQRDIPYEPVSPAALGAARRRMDSRRHRRPRDAGARRVPSIRSKSAPTCSTGRPCSRFRRSRVRASRRLRIPALRTSPPPGCR